MRTHIGTLGLLALLTGCKLTVIAPEGGDVEYVAEPGGCSAGNVCQETVNSALFTRSLKAVPKTGYTFVRWESGDHFLCGGSTELFCTLTLNGDDLSVAIAGSDVEVYAKPVFSHSGVDTDGDGLPNDTDPDDDNDDTADAADPCPLDPDPLCQAIKVFEDSTASATDDAEERASNGDMTRFSNDLDFYGSNIASSTQRIIGLHFNNSTIPAGATIKSAHLVFTTAAGGNQQELELEIWGEPEDSSSGADAFDGIDYDISSRQRTAALVPWQLTPINSAGRKRYSPDVRDIVQQIVDHPDWQVSEDDMTFILQPAQFGTGLGHQEVYSHDGAPDTASRPWLYIEYTEAP